MRSKIPFLKQIVKLVLLVFFASNSLSAMTEGAFLQGEEQQLKRIYDIITDPETGYMGLSDDDKSFLRPLAECTCPSFNRETRQKAENEAVNTAKDMFPPLECSESNPLVYVSYQSGFLLQDFTLLSKLIKNGYKHLKIHFIDHVCEESWNGQVFISPHAPRRSTQVTHSSYLRAKERLQFFLNQYVGNERIGLKSYHIEDYISAAAFIEASVQFDVLVGIHMMGEEDIIKMLINNKKMEKETFFSLVSEDKEIIKIIKYNNRRVNGETFYSEDKGASWLESTEGVVYGNSSSDYYNKVYPAGEEYLAEFEQAKKTKADFQDKARIRLLGRRRLDRLKFIVNRYSFKILIAKQLNEQTIIKQASLEGDNLNMFLELSNDEKSELYQSILINLFDTSIHRSSKIMGMPKLMRSWAIDNISQDSMDEIFRNSGLSDDEIIRSLFANLTCKKDLIRRLGREENRVIKEQFIKLLKLALKERPELQAEVEDRSEQLKLAEGLAKERLEQEQHRHAEERREQQRLEWQRQEWQRQEWQRRKQIYNSLLAKIKEMSFEGVKENLLILREQGYLPLSEEDRENLMEKLDEVFFSFNMWNRPTELSAIELILIETLYDAPKERIRVEEQRQAKKDSAEERRIEERQAEQDRRVEQYRRAEEERQRREQRQPVTRQKVLRQRTPINIANILANDRRPSPERDQEVERLLYERCNVNAVDDVYGSTALMFAAQSDNLDLVKLLLRYGADTNLTNKTGKKAIDYATSNDIRWLVFPLDERNIANILRYDSNSSQKRFNRIKELLRYGSYVNAVDDVYGLTALMFAAHSNDRKLVELLLRFNAKVNIINNNGNKAIDFARSRGRIESLLRGRHRRSSRDSRRSKTSSREEFERRRSPSRSSRRRIGRSSRN